MWHLITNLSNYMMFEVLEESWTTLQKQLNAAENLDEVIGAHNEYLEAIIQKALLDEDTKEVLDKLHSVLDLVIRFCQVQDEIFVDAFTEVTRRQELSKELEKHGDWGLDLEPDAGVSDGTLHKLRSLTKDYNEEFESLTEVLVMTKSSNRNLSFLNFRLDFNNYYKCQHG